MSGFEPPIKFVDPSKKKTIRVKNTDNLEIESASDRTISPPRKQAPVKSVSQTRVPTKQPTFNHKGTEGLEYLLNATKQRENDYSESEQSQEYDDDDYADGGGGGYYQDDDESEYQGGTGYQADNNDLENRNKEKYMSKQEKRQRKQEMLAKLLALKAKGIELTRNYDMNSRYSDIEFEYYTQKKALDSEAGVKFQRQFLVAAVTGLEYLNKRFDPIGAKLNGWSESVISDIDSYDEVFRKLYEKYSSRAELPPEIELLVLIVGSAFMFHMTNSILESAMGAMNNGAKTVVSGNDRGLSSDVASNISNTVKRNFNANESEMSGPSLNLSGTLGGNVGPPPPMVAPSLKKQPEETVFQAVNNDDRFSIVSSDTQVSISRRNKNGNKPKKTTIKTINL